MAADMNAYPEVRVTDEDVDPLRILVKQGRLFEVQEWIAANKPLLNPSSRKSQALALSIDAGFHSMVDILAAAWPDRDDLGCALRCAASRRRVDLVWLLLRHGGDMRQVGLDIVAECYDKELMRYFLDNWDTVGSPNGFAYAVLARAYNLIGVMREYAPRIPGGMLQLGMALKEFVADDNVKWVSLALWMGADARMPVPDLWNLDDEDEWDERYWMSPMELAVELGSLRILKLMKPSPERDDLCDLLSRAPGPEDDGPIEVAEYLLELGGQINDAQGGSTVLKRLLSLPRGGATRIEHIERWIAKGARYVATQPSDLREVRQCFYTCSSEHARRLAIALSRAADAETLFRILNTAKIRTILQCTSRDIKTTIEILYRQES